MSLDNRATLRLLSAARRRGPLSWQDAYTVLHPEETSNKRLLHRRRRHTDTVLRRLEMKGLLLQLDGGGYRLTGMGEHVVSMHTGDTEGGA